MNEYRIPEMARKYVEHDMIRTYTELPAFPDSRIRLLFAFLNQNTSVSMFSELYSLVVSLVQLGLDTHDTIDTEAGVRPEKSMRARQLKVLAGDYFSSRFYQLLSQAGQVDMIRRLSGAICQINRLKMNLYVRMKQVRVTAEEYLACSAELKAELFRVFAGLIEERYSKYWLELLAGLSRCEVVLDEWLRSDQPAGFKGSWAYWHVMQEGTEEEKRLLAAQPVEPGFAASLIRKYDIRNQLAALLRHSVEQLREIAAKLESDRLVRELCLICESFLRRLSASVPAFNEMR
ncbi:heptaprenyl diphosphate synthase component 1 [Paenibacillus cisolokensis]|jgi:heptaprenyl diphosphate synthase|uniref:Heptaprenyl diphosphate synthase n=1 Tax=Paenibacillus cisolokensis TaxID=1658519 RepID=A0ABQ4N0S9_9BACL|nr:MULTISPECIES: heptaprenyl diphosphate synthase component 1 [Paenibacillus]ALS27761.1 heptaprenyl diphosphate synthase [Paenibacillus sp. 32O-W]GIQ61747.1 hypothetical protein PACILC2_03150 [Paenibacillus cisolokensis]